jgi:hypothetical protein
MPELESIPVVLKTAMGTQEWELNVPLDVPVMRLIIKFVREPDLGFRERDDNGNLIPYRLMHQEANRYLAESETLRKAGVQANHTLVLMHEARAGLRRERVES